MVGCQGGWLGGLAGWEGSCGRLDSLRWLGTSVDEWLDGTWVPRWLVGTWGYMALNRGVDAVCLKIYNVKLEGTDHHTHR